MEWPSTQRISPAIHSRRPKPKRRGDGAVDDRDGARRTRQEDRLGQRAVERHFKAFDMSLQQRAAAEREER